MKKTLILSGVLLGLSGFVTSSAAEYTFSTTTSDFMIDAGVRNQGYWSPTRGNSDSNQGVIAGLYAETEAGKRVVHSIANFFTFNLSGLNLAGKQITSARIELTTLAYGSPDSSEIFQLHDVSTPYLTLNNNNSANAGIYGDLVGGDVYGSVEIFKTAAANSLQTIQLNANAIEDIALNAGGWFSVGGSVPTAETYYNGNGLLCGEYIMAGAVGSSVQRLVITTEDLEQQVFRTDFQQVPVPEVQHYAMILGAGLVGLDILRRKRKV
ncbi:MAG: hypothetical protein SFY81_13325 [Verrucomicrobiota bacterium]|nr:hypothetical protein [Verrucomicrobiota bacterium]